MITKSNGFMKIIDRCLADPTYKPNFNDIHQNITHPDLIKITIKKAVQQNTSNTSTQNTKTSDNITNTAKAEESIPIGVFKYTHDISQPILTNQQKRRRARNLKKKVTTEASKITHEEEIDLLKEDLFDELIILDFLLAPNGLHALATRSYIKDCKKMEQLIREKEQKRKEDELLKEVD